MQLIATINTEHWPTFYGVQFLRLGHYRLEPLNLRHAYILMSAAENAINTGLRLTLNGSLTLQIFVEFLRLDHFFGDFRARAIKF